MSHLFCLVHALIVGFHLISNVAELLFQLHDFHLLLVEGVAAAVVVLCWWRVALGRGSARAPARGRRHGTAVVAREVKQTELVDSQRSWLERK